jgi:hydrogenase expression/formation protein HypE
LRDLTRGGLASGLNELAEALNHALGIREADIPVDPTVRGLCELLGFDPLHVANEGRYVAFVAEDDADRARAIMNDVAGADVAADIGVVGPAGDARVTLESLIGVARVLDRLSGEQLPRIC